MPHGFHAASHDDPMTPLNQHHFQKDYCNYSYLGPILHDSWMATENMTFVMVRFKITETSCKSLSK